MATLLIIIAPVITGTIVGCWLTLVVATAAMSRSQQHMENKVRYWQGRVRQARAADRADRQPAIPDYWPGALAGQAARFPPGPLLLSTLNASQLKKGRPRRARSVSAAAPGGSAAAR